jgi:hypothetical protein
MAPPIRPFAKLDSDFSASSELAPSSCNLPAKKSTDLLVSITNGPEDELLALIKLILQLVVGSLFVVLLPCSEIDSTPDPAIVRPLASVAKHLDCYAATQRYYRRCHS